MTKKIVLTAIIAVIVAACGSPKKNTNTPAAEPAAAESLKTGDLVFIGIPMDYSLGSDSMDGAIAAATGDGELNLIHVAILEMDGDKPYIIDATLRHGVDRHPLDTMLKEFTLKDGSYPTFIVKRMNDNSLADEWISRAKSFCGQPYDKAFLPENGALYCSELVRDSYLGADGEYLFDEQPMNFLDSEGNMPVYWTQLFAILGQEVPQGLPGTNPQDMSTSPCLETVNISLTEGR